MAKPRATMFMDESGPTEDFIALGVVVVERGFEQRLADHLESQARQVEALWPKLVNLAEWKGSVCGRRPTRSRRDRIRDGLEPTREARASLYGRALASLQRSPGVWGLAMVCRWHEGSAGRGRGTDYRLRHATELALGALARHGFLITEAVIDHGHDAGYAAAFDRHYREGGVAISPRFVDSREDRRVQLADLIATAAKQRELPSKQFFPGLGGWLEAFAGRRLLDPKNSTGPAKSGPRHVTEVKSRRTTRPLLQG